MSYDENTTAVKVLVGNQWCDVHNTWHHPLQEGYTAFGVNSHKLGLARSEEFKKACRALGVKESNIHTEDAVWLSGHTEPLYSQTAIENVMMKYERKYPGAYHKTTSYYDGSIRSGQEVPSTEHQLCGRALQHLAQQGSVCNPRFYLTPLLWNYHDQLGYDEYNAKCVSKVQTALRQYGTWDPRNESYAIGFHSVMGDFDIVFNHTASRYHTLKD